MVALNGTVRTGGEYDNTSPITNLTYGGMLGYKGPVIGAVENGILFDNWYYAQPHIRQHTIAYVLSVPRVLDYFTNPQQAIAIYKALFEIHPKNISGLKSDLTVDYHDVAIDASGNQLSDVTKVSQAVSSLSVTWDEKYGKAIKRFWRHLVNMSLGDHYTQVPGISKYLSYDESDIIYGWEWKAGIILHVEPDPLRKRPVDAWLQIGVMPGSTGTQDGGRDIISATQGEEVSIDFKCATYNNSFVMDLAAMMLKASQPFQYDSNTILMSRSDIDEKVKNAVYTG